MFLVGYGAGGGYQDRGGYGGGAGGGSGIALFSLFLVRLLRILFTHASLFVPFFVLSLGYGGGGRGGYDDRGGYAGGGGGYGGGGKLIKTDVGSGVAPSVCLTRHNTHPSLFLALLASVS